MNFLKFLVDAYYRIWMNINITIEIPKEFKNGMHPIKNHLNYLLNPSFQT